MIEAEISRLTGLFLVEVVEIAVSLGIGIATLSLVVTAYNTNKQNKVSSANLILEILKPWRKDPFKKLLGEMMDAQITQYDESQLEEFLNQLETIAIFWKDGTLTDNHVKEFFGVNLKIVRDDAFIQKYMNNWITKNPDYYFVNLKELIKKVNKWKI